MKVNLQYKNGSSYILIPKTFRKLMKLDNEVEMEFENNKIIIKPINEKEKQEA